MTLPKNYQADLYEDQIYQQWELSGAFSPKTTGKPFSIMMPPPNATGTLHLGHAIMLAIQDIIVRQKRMQGYATLWLPGTDHAGIATQTRVEKNLLEKGIKKEDLGREKFLEEVNEFVENSKNTIRNQVKKMGSSCDWTRERFTLENHLNQVVNKVFCDMYNDGLIYKGHRIVNWDPISKTAIADDEVEYKEVKAKLYYIKYGPLEIATSRPETKLGDTAVAVNPNDPRYKKLIGQTLNVNFGEHQITVKVIADEAIDPEYGTGALGVTPAHSFIDYELAKKHDIDIIQVINSDGRMTEAAGKYKGLTVLEAREAFAKELEELGLLIKVEEYKQNLSISYRSGAAIEPLISEQWFIDVNKEIIDWEGTKKSLKQIALEVVKTNQIEIIPNDFEKTYFNWMENLHDWCISRQLWYGHRIPAWYHKETKELKVQAESPGTEWEQESDTLDTWFSSGLWTFSTLGWPEQTEDFKKFHPTDLLETGHDILFFWIARMILLTTYATKQIPFKKVYLHGLVRDKNGKKMSKSLGNGIDPIDMIAKYGTDALRLSLVIGNSPGNDLKIYEEKIESYRNFITKLWNASRFTLSKINNPKTIKEINTTKLNLADKWILTRLQETIKKGTDLLDNYRISEAGFLFYDFLWDEFCDWYLEFSKTETNEEILAYVLENILKLLHPYIPFATEQIYKSFNTKNLLITENWPIYNSELTFKEADDLNLIIKSIKTIRTEKSNFGVANLKDIEIVILANSNYTSLFTTNKNLIEKLGKVIIKDINSDLDLQINQASLAILNSDLKIYTLLEGKIDFANEYNKTQNEIDNLEKQIGNLENRLKNETYVKNAPQEIVAESKANLISNKNKLTELQKRLTILSS